MRFVRFILFFLIMHVTGKLSAIRLSRKYARRCNFNCNNCGMWSCTYNTDYIDYHIDPYDDYSNVCGKFGGK